MRQKATAVLGPSAAAASTRRVSSGTTVNSASRCSRRSSTPIAPGRDGSR
nr:hypothetical protein [Prauserella shujinwangii]